MDVFDLKNKIDTNYFDYQRIKEELKDHSHVRRYIGNLVTKGYLIRLKKGLYTWGSKTGQILYTKEIMANLLYGPSYVSLEYVLSYYRLIPERVEVITSVTTKKKKIFKTPLGEFQFEHLYNNAFPWGVDLKKINQKESFMMASPEKAILDTLSLRINPKDVTNFYELLEENLRIDMDTFNNLNQKKLLRLAQYYNTSVISKFSNFLIKR